MRRATFAGNQLPRQIKGHYAGTDQLSKVDALVIENGDEQNPDRPSIAVEFMDGTQDVWEWQVTDQDRQWSSWVKAQSGIPIPE